MEPSTTSFKPQGTRRSALEIQSIITDYRQSGLSRTEYCKLHKLNEGTLSTWLGRYKKKAVPQGFIPVSAAVKMTGQEGQLFAECRGVKFYQRVEAGYLKELLS
jgi:hypothetical protein